MKNIGIAIKEIRKKKKITQAFLSEISGISQTYISQIEKGNSRNPSIEILNTLCECLEFPIPVLMFFCLEYKDIMEEKRKAYKYIEPAIKGLITEFFLQ